MALKIAIARENQDFEKRVAATPDSVRKLIALGADVNVQTGAGVPAGFSDDAYSQAGAHIHQSVEATYNGAAVILCFQAPALAGIAAGTTIIGMMAPHAHPDFMKAAADNNIDVFAMELMPRITRAQGMDVLSSQSNLAGYKAVLDAVQYFPRALPMMMTAAGTIAPARVFVMGAGVAGLQAIATAKRLGAVVSATDVRPASKEQVQSLGATFVAVEDDEFKQAETTAGYAKPMSDEYKAKQQALIEETIKKQDIIITTALIPGRPAPRLITASMVQSMKNGSVIVDLAAEAGGNCELTVPGQIVESNGILIVGHTNVAGRLPTDASSLYARNLYNLLAIIVKDGALAIDWDDDIIKGIALTRGGAIIHPHFMEKQNG